MEVSRSLSSMRLPSTVFNLANEDPFFTGGFLRSVAAVPPLCLGFLWRLDLLELGSTEELVSVFHFLM